MIFMICCTLYTTFTLCTSPICTWSWIKVSAKWMQSNKCQVSVTSSVDRLNRQTTSLVSDLLRRQTVQGCPAVQAGIGMCTGTVRGHVVMTAMRTINSSRQWQADYKLFLMTERWRGIMEGDNGMKDRWEWNGYNFVIVILVFRLVFRG